MNPQHLTLWAGYRDHSEEVFNPSKLTSEVAGDVDSSVKTLRHLNTLPQLTTLHLVGCHIISERIFQHLPPFPVVLSDFQLDFSNESAEGRWFFVEDKDLMDKIRELEEQRSLH